jgi:glycosyltransferase involved in cell wall biosynthesis
MQDPTARAPTAQQAQPTSERLDARWPWLAEFEQRHGRPLRVLHIGNIANNAYRNALIQRAHGVEADVVCYDYYHIMGCPEWEGAEINGTHDAFLPDWWSLDVGDWPRPDWFIQGPQALCLDYLRAKHAGDNIARVNARLALVRHYASLLTTATRQANPLAPSPPDVLDPRRWAATVRLAPELIAHPLNGDQPPAKLRQAQLTAKAAQIGSRDWRQALAAHTKAGLLGTAHTARLADQGIAWDRDPASYPKWKLAARFAAGMTVSPLAELWTRRGGKPAADTQAQPSPIHTTKLIEPGPELSARYRAAFPTVPTEEIEDDLAILRAAAAPWRDVLGRYDVVHGYAFDASIPLFAGHKVFVAYEHGTIRLIPFEDTRRGRLCRFVYQEAPKAFITNTDVLPSADRIPIPHDRRVLTPHAFNDAPLNAFALSHPPVPRAPGPLHFFSPTRHHWRNGDTSWLKGNDVFLRAAGRFVAQTCPLRITLVEWGPEVADSKALIEELGLTPHVTWVPTLNRRQLWSAYRDCDCVVDQFAIPALGGVGYEALTLGARVLTWLDEPALATFFGEAPPILNAGTVSEAQAAIQAIVDDPDDSAGLKQRARAWAQTYHSTQRILDLEFAAYHELLPRAGDGAP